KADVVGMRMGEQYGIEVIDAVPERLDSLGEQVPVLGRASIHHDQLAGVLDHVEVRDAAVQTMDAISYLRKHQHAPVRFRLFEIVIVMARAPLSSGLRPRAASER